MTLMTPLDSQQHLLYFYSTIAQVAGALIGLIIVAFTFNAKPRADANQASNDQVGADAQRLADRERARHDSRLTFAGVFLLMAVVLASGVLLFFNGSESSILFSRAMLAAVVFEVTGGITYHRLWATGWPPGSEPYRKRQIRGRWLTFLTGVGAVATSVIVLPEVFHRRALGVEDLLLTTIPVIGGTLFGFFVFIHALRQPIARPATLPKSTLVEAAKSDRLDAAEERAVDDLPGREPTRQQQIHRNRTKKKQHSSKGLKKPLRKRSR